MMMTFKSFLSKQDDNIDDEEAIKEYANYKHKFKTEQLTKVRFCVSFYVVLHGAQGRGVVLIAFSSMSYMSLFVSF